MARFRVPVLVCLALAAGLAGDTFADAPPSTSSRRRRATRPRPLALPALVVPASASARDVQVGEACRRGLEGTSGAVVAMDPYTGRVMALVNPQRGMAAAYQPCSVFKIVVAVAGLTEGVITPDSTQLHGRMLDLARPRRGEPAPGAGAILQSLFRVGGRAPRLRARAALRGLLGLGSPSGINLAGEASGRIGGGASSQVGHLSSHAGISTSAVQLGVLSATLNGGIVYQPQVSGPDSFPARALASPPGTVVDGLRTGS